MSNLLPAYSTKLFTEIYESATDFATDYNGLGIPTTISSTNVNVLYYLLYARYGNSPIANNDENQFKFKLFTTIWQYGPVWEKKLDIQAILRDLNESQLKAGAIDTLTNTGTISNNGTNTGTVSTNTTNTQTKDSTIERSYTDFKTSTTGDEITNHAYNPESAPSTASTEELTYVNEQDVVKHGTDNTTSGSYKDDIDDSINDQGQATQTNNLANTNTQTNDLTNTNVNTKGILDAYSQLWMMLDADATTEFLNKFQYLFKQFVRPVHTLIFETDEDEDDE